MVKKILMIGAGISNLVLSRLFKDNGDEVEIREKENFIGGNCVDKKVEDYFVQKRGPHLLRFNENTLDSKIFIEKYAELIPFQHRVIALGNSSFTYWPPSKQYKELFTLLNPNKTIEEEFIKSYTEKVWGKDYLEVYDKVTSRFKIKDNFNTDFMEGVQMYMLKDGFVGLFSKLSKDIKVKTFKFETLNKLNKEIRNFDYIFVSSPIDEFCNYRFGKLEYKALNFTFKEIETDGTPLLLAPVINLNTHPEYIRATEYPRFYNSSSKKRIIGLENIDENGIKCYPVLTQNNLDKLKLYQEYLKRFPNIMLNGRLSEFKYKDMDVAIQDSINLFGRIKNG